MGHFLPKNCLIVNTLRAGNNLLGPLHLKLGKNDSPCPKNLSRTAFSSVSHSAFRQMQLISGGARIQEFASEMPRFRTIDPGFDDSTKHTQKHPLPLWERQRKIDHMVLYFKGQGRHASWGPLSPSRLKRFQHFHAANTRGQSAMTNGATVTQTFIYMITRWQARRPRLEITFLSALALNLTGDKCAYHIYTSPICNCSTPR